MWEKNILFDWPHAGLLLLLLFPLIYGQFALMRYRKRQQNSYTSSSLLPDLLTPRSPILTYTKIAGWGFVWAFACFALMEPIGNIRYSPLSALTPPASANAKAHYIPHQVIFLVDTSASMRVPDGLDGETRLEEAKNIMEDIISQLRGQTVSLYAFTSELSPVVPPTLDYLFVRLSIKQLHIDEGGVGGTRFAPVLKDLKQQAFSSPSLQNYTMILLSDGGDTRLETLKGEAREQEVHSILNAIPHPQQLHLHLFTVGLGSLKPQPIPHVTFEGKPVLSQLDPTILKELAAQERGKYYMAQNWTSWDLAQEIVSQMGENELTEQQEAQEEQGERQLARVKKEDILADLYYQVPLGLALLFYFINLMLPDVRR